MKQTDCCYSFFTLTRRRCLLNCKCKCTLSFYICIPFFFQTSFSHSLLQIFQLNSYSPNPSIKFFFRSRSVISFPQIVNTVWFTFCRRNVRFPTVPLKLWLYMPSKTTLLNVHFYLFIFINLNFFKYDVPWPKTLHQSRTVDDFSKTINL